MHWHRYYIWAYETALKTECQFKGTQPVSPKITSKSSVTNVSKYWNWGKYTDLTKSPIFNGDEWSMGGNGEAVSHKGGFIGRQIPAGPGGGCVKTGPFAKYVFKKKLSHLPPEYVN